MNREGLTLFSIFRFLETDIRERKEYEKRIQTFVLIFQLEFANKKVFIHKAC